MGMAYWEINNNIVGSVGIVNGKLAVAFQNGNMAIDVEKINKFYLSTYTPGTSPGPGPGPGPGPAPVTTYKFMQNGVDITNNVKSAIGTGSALSIKTSSSGGGVTTWETSNNISSIFVAYDGVTSAVAKDGALYMLITHWNESVSMKIAKSIDEGVTWSIISTPALPTDWGTNLPSTLIATQNRLLMFNLCPYPSLTNQSSVYLYSTDNGVTWVQAALPATRVWSTVTINNGVLILSDIEGQDDGTIYRSDNEGLTWTPVSEYHLRNSCYSQNKFVGLIGDTISEWQINCTKITSSIDDGVTWSTPSIISNITTGLPSGTYNWTDMVSDSQYVYLLGIRTDSSDNAFHIIRSSDGGTTFNYFLTVSNQYAPGESADDLYISCYNGEFLYSYMAPIVF